MNIVNIVAPIRMSGLAQLIGLIATSTQPCDYLALLLVQIFWYSSF